MIHLVVDELSLIIETIDCVMGCFVCGWSVLLFHHWILFVSGFYSPSLKPDPNSELTFQEADFRPAQTHQHIQKGSSGHQAVVLSGRKKKR